MNLSEHLKRIPKRSAAAPARPLSECIKSAAEATPYIRKHPIKDKLSNEGAFLCRYEGEIYLCIAFDEHTQNIRLVNTKREHYWKPGNTHLVEELSEEEEEDVATRMLIKHEQPDEWEQMSYSKQLIELFGGVWSQ